MSDIIYIVQRGDNDEVSGFRQSFNQVQLSCIGEASNLTHIHSLHAWGYLHILQLMLWENIRTVNIFWPDIAEKNIFVKVKVCSGILFTNN